MLVLSTELMLGLRYRKAQRPVLSCIFHSDLNPLNQALPCPAFRTSVLHVRGSIFLGNAVEGRGDVEQVPKGLLS